MTIARTCCVAVCMSVMTTRHRTAQPVALDPGAAHTNIWSGSALMSRPPMSWVLGTFYSPPSDWAAAPLAACTAPSHPLPMRGFVKGSVAETQAARFKVHEHSDWW